MTVIARRASFISKGIESEGFAIYKLVVPQRVFFYTSDPMIHVASSDIQRILKQGVVYTTDFFTLSIP
jgi:hypothetical protein